MNAKTPALQDAFLDSLCKEQIPVSIFLVNGIKLTGQIESFDSYVVLLTSAISQLVYKHAISTIVPSRNVTTAFIGSEQPDVAKQGKSTFGLFRTLRRQRDDDSPVSNKDESYSFQE